MAKQSLFDKTFRQMMVEMRQEHLYTQKSLSVKSGLSRQFISQMEAGLRGPSFESFCKLAWGLGISPAKLSERFMAIYERENVRVQSGSPGSEAAEYIKKARESGKRG
ncbi:helix-turn-helix domain-containing protein [Fibrobacter sp. UBA4309]|uniref:helix-turn-helix domain-containing protein n=1 Tax=Fibrobacter sp. UBA4309 TaxID=1946537 RepID=UPI0025C3CFF0|nr:helix-turn-helix transcriptional regulator [Fibrobacter sp. UBA4309]